ncbi:hypothetical protein [Marivita sp.]|uniref:hypothetical protein n=1 Tax=Marivita sp. TaxID=2003365 RepID=UPI003F6B7D41
MFLKYVWAFLFTLLLSVLSLGGSVQPAAAERGIAFGLNGIADWSTQHPFIDVMKSGRRWIGHLPNQWGGVDFEDEDETALAVLVLVVGVAC